MVVAAQKRISFKKFVKLFKVVLIYKILGNVTHGAGIRFLRTQTIRLDIPLRIIIQVLGQIVFIDAEGLSFPGFKVIAPFLVR